MASTQSNEADLRRYASWFIQSKAQRTLNGLPEYKKDMAELIGVTTRTLRRWEDLEEFQEVVDEFRRNEHIAMQPSAEAAAEDGLKADYEHIRNQVIEGAKKLERDSLKLFMDLWGKEYAEQELEARKTPFAELTQAEVVDELIEILGADVLRQRLEDLGC